MQPTTKTSSVLIAGSHWSNVVEHVERQDTINKQSFHHNMWSLAMRLPKTVGRGELLKFDKLSFDNTLDKIRCIDSKRQWIKSDNT